MTDLYTYILINIDKLNNTSLLYYLKEHEVNCLVKQLSYRFPDVSLDKLRRSLIEEYNIVFPPRY